MALYKSMEELVGKTPLVELQNIEKKLNLKARLLAKLEYFLTQQEVLRIELHFQ